METKPYITLQQALKKYNLVSTGGEAKFVIQNGEVKVDGILETRRGRKLYG
ncbi:MAG TPA: RNA-binding S4 domain-containing protein, partial [Bacilli bacterium]|nr:RNA-binding S4 domain-containing protein [Bacilli bacterium]